MDGGEVVERGDHLVGDPRQQARGLDPAPAVLQPLLGDHPAPEQGGAQDIQGALALSGLVAARLQRRRGELYPELHAVDDIFQTGRAQAGRTHGLHIGRFAAPVARAASGRKTGDARTLEGEFCAALSRMRMAVPLQRSGKGPALCSEEYWWMKHARRHALLSRTLRMGIRRRPGRESPTGHLVRGLRPGPAAWRL